MRILALFVAMVLSVFAFCGCGRPPIDYFLYRDSDFDAELTGEHNGIAFCMRVSVKKCDNSEDFILSAEYLAPVSLTGVTLQAVWNPESNAPCQAKATLGELAVDVSPDSIKGLLAPLTALLAVREIATIQKETSQNAYCITFVGGEVLVVSQDAVPLSFSSPSLLFQVSQFVFWEENS